LKRLERILLLLALIAAIIFAVTNKFMVYGLVAVATLLGFYLILKMIVGEKDGKIEEMERRIKDSDSRIRELEDRKISVSQISSIAELGLMEVDSSFTRVFNRTCDDGKKRFIGALRIDIRAKYGVDLKELRFKREAGKVKVANLNPKFLSVTGKKCEWQIAETMELTEANPMNKKLFGSEDYWRTRSRNDKLTMQICDEIMRQTELEMETGIEELEWTEKIMRNQIMGMLKLLFSPDTETIACDCDETFVGIEGFLVVSG
jgi:Ca2+/Na+ antiporter